MPANNDGAGYPERNAGYPAETIPYPVYTGLNQLPDPVMNKLYVIASLVLAVFLLTMCNKAALFNEDGYDDRLSGGAATVFDETSKAFTHSADGLSDRDELVHGFGDRFFEQTFVAAPAPVNSGLGPVFNN